MRRVPPSQACALPIRPPRLRYSSVSTQNQIRSALRVSRTRATTASLSAPPRAAAHAASASSPVPPQALSLSITATRSPRPRSASSACAWRAAS